MNTVIQGILLTVIGVLLTVFLEGLPQEARLVFLRRYWYGDTVREVLAITGVPEQIG